LLIEKGFNIDVYLSRISRKKTNEISLSYFFLRSIRGESPTYLKGLKHRQSTEIHPAYPGREDKVQRRGIGGKLQIVTLIQNKVFPC
jgi:hypothetical protein